MVTRRRARHVQLRSAALALRAGVALLLLATAVSPLARPSLASEPVESEPVVTPFEAAELLQARALRGLRTEVAALALGGETGGDLTLAALAVPIPSASETALVPVFVEIDGAGFLQFQQGEVARVEAYIYALDAGGRIVDYIAEVFVVDVADLGERIWQSGLEFFGWLELPAGSYSVRVLVRNFQSRAYGLQVLSLDVPAEDASSPRALTPLIADPAEREGWLPVRSWRTLETGYPLLSLGLGVNPAVRPVLPMGRKLELIVPVAALGDGLPEAKLELVSEGKTIATAAAGAVVRRAGAPAGFDLLAMSFPVPAAAPGIYLSRVRLEHSTGTVTSPGLEVLLVEAETRERDLLWTDLRWLVAPRAAEAASSAPTPPSRSGRGARRETRRVRGELAAGYRAVLAHLASGAGEAARGALFDLESAAMQSGRAGSGEHLLAAELEVASQLGRENTDSVVPLVLLHAEMHERYRGRRSYALIAHTQRLLERLADLHVESGGSPEAGADMLSGLAGVLQEANLVSGSRRLFQRALEYDPSNRAALLGLAATFEKYGEYTTALAHLEQLVVVAPELDEGKLRLAMVLERVGLRRRGRELLEQLVDAGTDEWVRAVAYQELGRVLLHTGATRAAVERLEEGVLAMPGRQGLRMLTAHAYDRLGRTDLALRHLSAVEPAADEESSERLVYDRWPRGELDRIRRRLGEIGRQAIPALAEAVNGAAAEQGGAR